MPHRLRAVRSPSSRQQLSARSAGTVTEQCTAAPARAFPERRDNFFERSAIVLLSFALARFLTTEALRDEARKIIKFDMTFKDFSRLTKLLLRRANGSIEGLQERIVQLLDTLVPRAVKQFFRETMASNARLVCEQSSEWIARFGLISWLIGSELERFHVSVPVPAASGEGSLPLSQCDGQAAATEELWLSGLEAKQCRYLLESGCKSTCVNICKIPTQAFFNDVIGLPLRMTPDYESGACKFEFGLKPLPKEEDPAFSTPCYLGCSLSLEKTKSASVRCS